MSDRAPEPHGPRVYTGNATRHGSCNCCTRWHTDRGLEDHMVLVVEGRSISMRFCKYCLEEVARVLPEMRAFR